MGPGVPYCRRNKVTTFGTHHLSILQNILVESKVMELLELLLFHKARELTP
jgi:hypothetical protein